MSVTESFLLKNELPYDKIHLSCDKTVLIGECDVVVDDSPHVLDAAAHAGVPAVGLEFPWNCNRGYQLFNSLSDIAAFISEIAAVGSARRCG